MYTYTYTYIYEGDRDKERGKESMEREYSAISKLYL